MLHLPTKNKRRHISCIPFIDFVLKKDWVCIINN